MSIPIQENISLKPYNTFGLEVKARFFATVTSVDALGEVLEKEQCKGMPLLVLGGGSNMLLTQDVAGLVLKIEIPGIEVVEEDGASVKVAVGAGVNWHELVLATLEKGWQGLENLSLIPGNTGAAPIQNIGAYGVELKDLFDHLEAYEIASGKMRVFHHHDCQFDYRNSVFKQALKGQYIITKVVLRLNKQPQLNTSYGAIRQVLTEKGIADPSAKDISEAVIQIRESKLPDPQQIGNSGSFFKNPEVPIAFFEQMVKQYPHAPSYPTTPGMVKVPAGWLIEQCGWKGKRVGNTGTYAHQALVLVNHGDASGAEIKALAYRIMEDVEQKMGIRLEPEVNII